MTTTLTLLAGAWATAFGRLVRAEVDPLEVSDLAFDL